LITGEQLAPYHWGYAYGPAVSFVVLAVTATELQTLKTPKASLIFGVLFCADLVVSMYLRVSYAHYSGLANQVRSDYTRYIAQQEGPSRVPLVGNSVVAGDDGFCGLAAIGDNQHPLAAFGWNSVSLSDDEIEKRIAFNARLEGLGRAEFVEQANALISLYPPALFNPAKGPVLINGLLHHYDLTAPEMNQLAGDYAVRYVAIPINRTDPKYLENGWRPIASGPYWRIWERVPL
jgi:hypothetical protein